MSAQNEHRAARFRSCYFTIFCVNILTKRTKRFIISLQMNIGIQEQGSRGICASTEKRGVNPRRRNGTVRCMFFPMARRRGHSGETGEGFAERTGESPHTKSGYSVPIFSPAFPAERMRVHKCVCTKAFVALVLFVYMNRRSVLIILYCVKNGVFCLQAAITAHGLLANIEKEK